MVGWRFVPFPCFQSRGLQLKCRFENGCLIFFAESLEDFEIVESLSTSLKNHLLECVPQGDKGLILKDVGPKQEVAREPINITSLVTDTRFQLISNLAQTPFELDGKTYASVEGFWQGLKFEDEADRRRLSALHGLDAKLAGHAANPGIEFTYGGTRIPTGRPEHWKLMFRACEAKFSQHEGAQQALLLTGERPLQHNVRHDREAIPGIVIADIWMRIRSHLRQRVPETKRGVPELRW